MPAVTRGRAVQRTGAFVRGRRMRALGHRVNDVHLESKGELQRQDGQEDTDE